MDELIAEVNKNRLYRGFLSVEDTVALAKSGNLVMDPWSTLVSSRARLGHGNVLYPNIIIEVLELGAIRIGNDNTFFPGSVIAAAANGQIIVGDANEFGEDGTVVRANRDGSAVEIGSNCRFVNGPKIMGRTHLGNGAQLIGAITVQDCFLEGGGSYKDPDPNARAALLKGHGLARGLTVGRGKVINGDGAFDSSMIELQAVYHRKA